MARSMASGEKVYATAQNLPEETPIFAELLPEREADGEETGLNTSPNSFRLQHFQLGYLRRGTLRLELQLLHWRDSFFLALQREREMNSLFNFVPVFFALGVLAYFAAPQEPHFPTIAVATLFVFFICMRLTYYGVLYHVLLCLGLTLAGFGAASLQTARMNQPQIEREFTTHIAGLVVDISQNRRGAPRYLIEPTRIEGIEKRDLPHRVRVSTGSKKYKSARIGQMISGKARLQPISGPAYPGGYDFSFFSWYQGLGGAGYFLGAPTSGATGPEAGAVGSLASAISRLRLRIEERIIQAVPNEGGDIAVALITGNRTRLDDKTQSSLRQSGLAHILAISGLHMALVTLTVIGFIRIGASLVPNLSLKYPIKKIAVVVGFCAATAYLTISGASIATRRAWLMVAVMLLAVLLDRKALTMRTVALAALIILILWPSSLISPGFQMSFAAVAMLVACYGLWENRKNNDQIKPDRGWFLNGARTLFAYFGGLGFTSLVAGGGTMAFAAYHFHAVASLGILANLLAMPIVTLAVMPLALVSVLLMPFGFEAAALVPMAVATGWVVDLAEWVNGLGSQTIVGQVGRPSLILFAVAMVLFVSFRSRLRWLSIPAVFCAGLVFHKAPAPNILIAENGRSIAVTNAAGQYEYLYPGRNRFITDIWKKAWPNEHADLASGSGVKSAPSDKCGKDYCEKKLENGLVISIVYAPKQIQKACRRSDILVAPRLWWINCKGRSPPLILKRHDFEQYGGHAIYFKAQGRISATDLTETSGLLITPAVRAHIEHSLPETTRPWNRQVSQK